MKKKCLADGTILKKEEIKINDQRIMIHQCTSCNGVWLDSGTFNDLKEKAKGKDDGCGCGFLFIIIAFILGAVFF